MHTKRAVLFFCCIYGTLTLLILYAYPICLCCKILSFSKVEGAYASRIIAFLRHWCKCVSRWHNKINPWPLLTPSAWWLNAAALIFCELSTLGLELKYSFDHRVSFWSFSFLRPLFKAKEGWFDRSSFLANEFWRSTCFFRGTNFILIERRYIKTRFW